jgi:hypothetical protein
MNRIFVRVGWILSLVAASVQAETTYRLATDEIYHGTVQYDANHWADWVVFYAAGTSGSVGRAGSSLISDIRIDRAYLDADMTAGPISTSWTGGEPLESATTNHGAKVALTGSQYWQVQNDGASTWLQFDVVSPRSDYVVDFYAHWWAMAVDLQMVNAEGSTSLGTFDHGTDYAHLAVEIRGSAVGETNTVKFTNFSGNETWGQFSVYSAAVAVPEPSARVMAGLCLLAASFLCRKRD